MAMKGNIEKHNSLFLASMFVLSQFSCEMMRTRYQTPGSLGRNISTVHARFDIYTDSPRWLGAGLP